MSTPSTESLDKVGGITPHEDGNTHFVAINMVKPTEATTEGHSVDKTTDTPDKVQVTKEAEEQGDDNAKGAKRKRTLSSSGVAEATGSGLTNEACKSNDHDGRGASRETGKGPKAKKGRNKASVAKKDGTVKPAPAKKKASAGKKGKGEGARGKAGGGAEGKPANEEDNDGANPTDLAGLALTTPPPDDGNANAGELCSEKPKHTGGEKGAKSPSGTKKVWTPAEDEMIISLIAKKIPFKDIAAALNESISTCAPVDPKMINNRYHRVLKHLAIIWSDEEVQTLKEYYEAVVKDPYTALADKMNKELDVKKFTKLGCERKIKEVLGMEKVKEGKSQGK